MPAFIGMNLEILLNMLGNETRREILQLLSERPCYVSELSQTLNIGQKAVIEHLELMRHAGILETRLEKIDKGRPRKYYHISEDILIEVKISPHHFYIETLLPEINEEVLTAFPKLAEVVHRLDETSRMRGWERVERLRELYHELMKEHEKINEAKRVVEYLQREIREEIKKEVAIEELRELLYH
jgi:ArsR family transcriptional regulator